jgi:hypothetical protein
MTTAVIQMMGMSPPKATGIDATVVNAGEAAPTGDGGVDVSGYTRVAVVLTPTGSPACTLRPWVRVAGAWQRVRSNTDGALVEYTTLAGEGFVMAFDCSCCERFFLQVQAISASSVARSYRVTGPGA